MFEFFAPLCQVAVELFKGRLVHRRRRHRGRRINFKDGKGQSQKHFNNFSSAVLSGSGAFLLRVVRHPSVCPYICLSVCQVGGWGGGGGGVEGSISETLL